MEKYKKIIYYITIGIIFILGFYIRTKLYLLCDYFEDDECRLAIVLQEREWWQIFSPLGPLSCTPLFLLVSKIIAEVSHYSEYALKSLPFVFSLCSLYFFYKLCKEYFERKFSICLGLFLFAVNKYVIHFSSIFKTYSLEIFISILCLYYFPKINPTELTKKQLILFSLIFACLPLISFPSIFFIATFLILWIYKTYKNRYSYIPILTIIIPFLIVFALYYFVNLVPTKEIQLTAYSNYWNKYLSASVISVIAIVIRFLNEPNTFTLFSLVLFCCFILYVIFNKKEHTQINLYIILSVMLSLFASILKMYPLIVGRTALYLYPMLTLMSIKLLDSLRIKSIPFFVILLFVFVSYYKYFRFEYYKQINNVIPTFRNYAPKVLMKELKSQFNEKTDIVITTEESAYSYVFYIYKENFMPQHTDERAIKLNDDKEKAFKYLNSLNPNQCYWFYLIKEYKEEPLRKYFIEWINGQNILYKKIVNNSYLYYIKGAIPQEYNP